MSKRFIQSLLLISLLLTGNSLFAQEKIPWTELSFEERQILQQLQIQENQWESLPAERQQRIRRGATRFERMQPTERAQALTQQRQFQNLNQQQQQVIQRFQRFNALSGEQQRRLRQFQQRFQNLPERERQELRRRYQEQITRLQRERQIQQDATNEIRQSRRRVQQILQQNNPNRQSNRNPRRPNSNNN